MWTDGRSEANENDTIGESEAKVEDHLGRNAANAIGDNVLGTFTQMMVTSAHVHRGESFLSLIFAILSFRLAT